MMAGAVAAGAGSSAVVDRGGVTYSNGAKTDLVGVPEDLLAAHGAVSAPVAEAMAAGGLAGSQAQLVVSVTGIAGPGGGSAAKPVGLVFIGLAQRGLPPQHQRHVFPGDRRAVRTQTVTTALNWILSVVGDSGPR